VDVLSTQFSPTILFVDAPTPSTAQRKDKHQKRGIGIIKKFKKLKTLEFKIDNCAQDAFEFSKDRRQKEEEKRFYVTN